MLSLLPQLFSYQIVAFAILRLTVSFIAVLAGFSRYNKSYKWTSVFYFVTAFFLLLGLYTQLFAIAGIILVCFDFWAEGKISTPTYEKKLLYLVCVVILLSLLFTGPGFLAIDKPL